jgi:hypothetical protein
MKNIFLALTGMLISILTIDIVSASYVLVWRRQHRAGTASGTGTHGFNFSAYDAPTGGNT